MSHSANRTADMILGILAPLCLLFGAWGLWRGFLEPRTPKNNEVAAAIDIRTPRSRNSDGSAADRDRRCSNASSTNVEPAAAAETPDETVKHRPDDRMDTPPSTLPDAAHVPRPAGAGVISGRIFFEDGRPAPGAVVFARYENNQPPWPEMEELDQEIYMRALAARRAFDLNPAARTTADSLGNYSLTGLDPTQNYTLNASATGGRVERTGVGCGGGADLYLEPEYVIEGRVTDLTGAPVRSFSMSLWWNDTGRRDFNSGHYTTQSLSFHDTEGRFRFRADAPYLMLDCWSSGLRMPKPLELDCGGERLILEIVLHPAARIELSIRDASGRALTGMTPYVQYRGRPEELEDENFELRASEQLSTYARFDSRGRAKLDNLRPGVYSFHANVNTVEGTIIRTLAPGDNPPVEFKAKGAHRVEVSLTDASGAAIQANSVRLEAATGGSGGFALAGPRPGTMLFVAVATGDYILWANSQNHEPIKRKVNVSEDLRITLVLNRSSSLSGRISSKDGAPLPRLEINALLEGDEAVEYSVFTRYDGSYHLTHLKKGRLTIHLRDSSSRLLQTQVLDLVEGINRHDFVLESRCSLTVKVRDSSGKPVSEFGLMLTTAGGLTSSTHGFDGVCRVLMLQPGSHEVTAFNNPTGMFSPRVTINLKEGENELTLEMRKSDCVRVSALLGGSQNDLRPGDLILTLDSRPTPDTEVFNRLWEAVPAGTPAVLSVMREGRTLTLTIPGGNLGVSLLNAVR